jgi:UDP-hydrolysing UDP-N-acetyl-D-glucosamine 2-epimerase
MPRTIAVVTGTRAEFGLLRTVMRAIAAHPRLRLRTIVTGAHLTRGTWRDVAAAGLPIDARVPMQKPGGIGRAADGAALGRGIIGISRVLAATTPDFVVVLGDRIEAFAAASAASIGGIRVAHLHGGDRAEGVADEAMRHAISKLSHLHFAATVRSRNRLVRMGEWPELVFNVGSPAADELRDVVAAGDAPDFIVMMHPVGGDDLQERRWMMQTLRASARRLGSPAKRLIIAPNSDAGSSGIRAALKAARADFAEHLPRDRFVAMLKGAKAIVGNSSAGLIEAAILRVPCVNIGPRQNGREKPRNVVDCDYGQSAVAGAIDQAMGLDLRGLRHPYGDGGTGERVAGILAEIGLSEVSLRKRNAY